MVQPRRQAIQPTEENMFVTWNEGDEQGRAIALSRAYDSHEIHEPIVRRTQASHSYHDIQPGSSIREPFSRSDYEDFRPGEAIPTKPKEIIKACMTAYDQCGIVRHVVDMMSDFASEGIGLRHPNERIEKFYKEWFRKIDGPGRSEQFLNNLYGAGNVVIKRHTAKLTIRQADHLKRAKADPDMDVEEVIKPGKREVPWRYSFLNPLTVEVQSEELSVFVGQDDFTFSVRLPATLAQKIKHPKSEREKELVAKLPENIKRAARDGTRLVPLDPDKVRGFYYRRKDWQVWARPMTYAILPDLYLLKKMKLADQAALDGAISCIRVWKLGNIEARILPTAQAINRLSEMLMSNVGGGVMDLVWGPELELVETSTEVHRFLGEAKYAPVLSQIYGGLGVPSTLSGGSSKGGFTNNAISLKTIIKRLEYGRQQLIAFWNEEIRRVQKAMGFRFPAQLVFARMTLSDEAAEKQLLLHMVDRGLLSDETFQERVGEAPDIESVRLRREQRRRDGGQMSDKAGPYHISDKEHELKKAFIQTKTLTPSEVGLELDEKKEGEKPPIELEAKFAPKPAGPTKPKGQPGQGRPKNSKDQTKRKQKVVKPRTAAQFMETFAWAESAQSAISLIVAPKFLKAVGKRNLREVSNEDAREFERLKFGLLCQLDVEDMPSEASIASLLKGPLPVPSQVDELVKTTVANFVNKHGREPSLEVVRRFQAGAYAMWMGEFDETASDTLDGPQALS